MAKKVRTQARGSAGANWQTDWPENDDLKQWLLCWIRKCTVPVPENEKWTFGSDPKGPIEDLAEMGEVQEALRQVDRLLGSLSAADLAKTAGLVAFVCLAEQGAEICDAAGDVAQRERYLAQVASKGPLQKGSNFIPNSIRKFRAENGLLDPQEAIDEDECNLAAYAQARRRVREGRGKARAAALADMERFALKTEDMYDREKRLKETIMLHVEQGNAAEVQRLIKKIPKDERDDVLKRPSLWKLGLKREAMLRSKREIAKRQKILANAGSEDLKFNEFQIRAICRELVFLAEQKEKGLARKEFTKLLQGAKSWQILEARRGTPSLAQYLADTLSAIDGPKAAEKFLAAQQGNGVKGRVWKEISCDEALAQARKISSPAKRRIKQTDLLVAAGRWQDLAKILAGAATPKEAKELCWAVASELGRTVPA